MNLKWWVLVSVACGTFMATLDSSIVNIALPTLTVDLGSDIYRIKWVAIIYLLVITCLLLPFGRMSDQHGRKLVFRLGFIIFFLGSALCGIAPGLAWLVGFRAFQGVGAAMLMANGPAIITSAFSTKERGTALGFLAMVVGLGLVTGPSIGGFLISNFGWRSIFLVNLPIALAGTALVHKFVKPDPEVTRSAHRFDWVGAFLQSLILILFMVLFDPPHISISGSAPFPVSRWATGSIIMVLVLILVKVEAEVPVPLFDVSLLKNRSYWTANLANFFVAVAFTSVSVLMPFFLEAVLHYPPQEAGALMSAIPLTILVVAPISGRLSDYFGSLELCLSGSFIGVLGLFWMAGVFGGGINEHSDSTSIVLGLCVIGLATGLFQSPNNNAVMSAVPVHKLSVASALLATVRNLGLATGTDLSTSVLSWVISATGNFVTALHSALFVAGLVCIGAMGASLGKLGNPRKTAMKSAVKSAIKSSFKKLLKTPAKHVKNRVSKRKLQ